MNLDAASIAAIAGAASLGLVALVLVVVLWVKLARLRAAQQVLLGDGGASSDIVASQADLTTRVSALRDDLSALSGLVDAQARHVADELSTVIRFQGLVRYDAYRDMGGGQSWSMALLDQNACGTVISCLHARDHARVYVKDVADGGSSQRLSPEEQRAIGLAMGAETSAQPDSSAVGAD